MYFPECEVGAGRVEIDVDGFIWTFSEFKTLKHLWNYRLQDYWYRDVELHRKLDYASPQRPPVLNFGRCI